MQEDLQRVVDFSAESAECCMLTTRLKSAEVMCQYILGGGSAVESLTEA